MNKKNKRVLVVCTILASCLALLFVPTSKSYADEYYPINIYPFELTREQANNQITYTLYTNNNKDIEVSRLRFYPSYIVFKNIHYDNGYFVETWSTNSPTATDLNHLSTLPTMLGSSKVTQYDYQWVLPIASLDLQMLTGDFTFTVNMLDYLLTDTNGNEVSSATKRAFYESLDITFSGDLMLMSKSYSNNQLTIKVSISKPIQSFNCYINFHATVINNTITAYAGSTAFMRSSKIDFTENATLQPYPYTFINMTNKLIPSFSALTEIRCGWSVPNGVLVISQPIDNTTNNNVNQQIDSSKNNLSSSSNELKTGTDIIKNFEDSMFTDLNKQTEKVDFKIVDNIKNDNHIVTTSNWVKKQITKLFDIGNSVTPWFQSIFVIPLIIGLSLFVIKGGG